MCTNNKIITKIYKAKMDRVTRRNGQIQNIVGD